MQGRPRWLRIALVCCLVSFAVSGTARAEEFQTTKPDACAVLRHSDLAPTLGSHVHSHTNKFPLPELSETDQDINHFLTVSRTQCTWADASKQAQIGQIELVTVNVLDRNENYSGGGEPWSTEKPAIILVAIGTTKVYSLKDNDFLAEKLHQPQLAGDDVFIAVDRKTGGRRRAILGYRFNDGLWAYFGAITYKQSALNVLIRATRRVVAG